MHQYLTFIGDFPIRFYGIFFSLGILSGCITAYFLLKKTAAAGRAIFSTSASPLPSPASSAGGSGTSSSLTGIIIMTTCWRSPYVWQGGMAIQGGLIFACTAAYIYLRKNKIPVLPFADTVAPAVILGQAVGRIANFMNGDAFGHPTGEAFGLLYPHTTLAYRTYGAQPLWPAEVWECQGDILIFVLLLWYSCFRHAKGTVFCLYVMLYSLLRFFLEYLRGDYGTLLLGLKSAQLTSLAAFTIAALCFLYFHFRYRDEPEKR